MKVENININLVKPDKNQPRKKFVGIDLLSDSIKEKGVLCPLTVRKEKDHFIIIDGGRRYKAAIEARIEELPCIVRETKDYVDEQLITDLHKQKLSFSELFVAFEKLISEGYSMPKIMKSLSISRSAVNLYMRTSKLNKKSKEFIRNNKLSLEQVRGLVIREKIIDEDRVVEEIVEKNPCGDSIRKTIEKYQDFEVLSNTLLSKVYVVNKAISEFESEMDIRKIVGHSLSISKRDTLKSELGYLIDKIDSLIKRLQ